MAILTEEAKKVTDQQPVKETSDYYAWAE